MGHRTMSYANEWRTAGGGRGEGEGCLLLVNFETKERRTDGGGALLLFTTPCRAERSGRSSALNGTRKPRRPRVRARCRYKLPGTGDTRYRQFPP